MKGARILAIVVISLVGCSEDNQDNNCVQPKDALEDISSLANIVKSGRIAGRPSCIVYSMARIYSCKYKGETTYYFTNLASSNSVCNAIVYDCRGDEIINRGTDEPSWTAFEAEKTDEELLWERD
jgi:hypothetical protein